MQKTQTFTWIHGEQFDYPEGYEFICVSPIMLLWQKRSEAPEEDRVKGTARYKYIPTRVIFYKDELNKRTFLDFRVSEVPLRSLLFLLKHAKRPKYLTNP
tara:strand:- start:78 stop:377 length:300 start_codon:yes stop_codon:yes gene_type:complete